MGERGRLKERVGQRMAFTGRFVWFGRKRGWVGEGTTVLLEEVQGEAGVCVADPGDRISFRARVQPYAKGYRGRDWDHRPGRQGRARQ